MKLWTMVAILAVGFFLASAYLYRSHQPTERSFTMKGKKTVVCGEFTVPFDTEADRVQARGMRKDCGIYPGWKDVPGKVRNDPKPAIEL
jgi:hypothetical protein